MKYNSSNESKISLFSDMMVVLLPLLNTWRGCAFVDGNIEAVLFAH